VFNERLLFGDKSYPTKIHLARVIIALLLLLSLLVNFVQTPIAAAQGPVKEQGPVILQMVKAGSYTGDLRKLPIVKPVEREEEEETKTESELVPHPIEIARAVESVPSAQFPQSGNAGAPATPSASTLLKPEQTGLKSGTKKIGLSTRPVVVGQHKEVSQKRFALKVAASAPAPIMNFDGLGRGDGSGVPSDQNGDVGPTYYIQAINDSFGIYTKTTGSLVVARTFDALMGTGGFTNSCNSDNYTDPVVLYDSFEDRWILTDVALVGDSTNVSNPYQCFAVSKSGDPVTGGWDFYSISIDGGWEDYPKFGIWPDGLYMSANILNYTSSIFYNVRVYAFNKAQMYAGASTVQAVAFDVSSTEYTLLPANARLQTGTPPSGSPNYYATVWQYSNAVSVYKLYVDWNSVSASIFTGPFISMAPSNWASAPITLTAIGAGAPLKTVSALLMMQNQYTNIGGVESLWNSHTVQGSASISAAPRFYQVTVTSGTIGISTTQAFTHNPDSSTLNRWMPSAAVDRAGDMAIGYTAASTTISPSIRYAGRLVTDTLSTLPQTETVLYQGNATQNGSDRWGDYSAMTLDPDGCTFWYTNEYYTGTNDLNFRTRIGSFKFPSCTSVGNGGTITGTAIDASNSSPMNGVTVTFGSRITTTNGSGIYKFLNIPAGVYPSIAASYAGYSSSSAGPITVTDNLTTTQNFSLTTSAAAGCFADTTQSNFQTGVPANCDLTDNPNTVVLLRPVNLAVSNTNVLTTPSVSFSSTNWAGQTFLSSITGTLKKIDVALLCSGCIGTTPNISVEIRSTAKSSGVDKPTTTVLASSTISGFSGSVGVYRTAYFNPQPTLTTTTYAFVFHAASDPSVGNYAYLESQAASAYGNGDEMTGDGGGGSAWTKVNADLGFHTYTNTVYTTTGTFVSNVKDANPAINDAARWITLTWNATTPANTGLRFQAAASISSTGPFNFVGPDGTSSTYFTTTGASLSQFDGLRYLQYKAYLTTTNILTTPMLSDVTVCYSNTSKLTNVSITSSQNPLLSGQGVTFTVNVTSPSGVPTGTIVFKDSGSNFGLTQTLSGGSAAIFTTTLPIGSHTITATYSGNTFFNANTGSLATDQVVTSTATWNGSTSTAWNTPGNWNTNAAPGSIHSAYIPASGVITEAATSSVITITNLTLDTGRTLTLGADLNLSGNWADNGTLTPNSNTVTFIGSNNTQTLSGATTFYILKINHAGTGSVIASGSTLNVSNLLNVVSGTLTSGTTYKDVQINSGTTLASDGGTLIVDGNWTNNGTFNAGSGTVTFNGAVEQTIGGSNVTAYNNMIVVSGTRIVIPTAITPTITGTLTVQSGGALKQTRTVSNATVSFLQISSLTGTNKYRGVDLTTINNLGNTTVVITATASNTCPLTDGGSPAYANRCYSITPTTNATATVKLWALNPSELNSIAVSNLAPYHHDGNTTWVKLTNLSTGTDSGSYAFAQGDTTGFSPFLLGGPNAPTAITLIDFSAASTSTGYLLLAALIALVLLITGWLIRRRASS
jgi:hypothetical protein